MPADIGLLLDKLKEMKEAYEKAIRKGDHTGLIRSKRLINLLHEYVIEELNKRVEPSWVVTDKKVYGYNPDAAKEKRVELSERYNLEKYILSFLSIAKRGSPNDVPWKYEKVCLLVVDFERSPPKIIEDLDMVFTQGRLYHRNRRNNG